MPATVGVTEIVITLFDHDALTPAGKPDAMPIPVAPVVVWVILANGLLIQSVGVDEATEMVFIGRTLMVPVALTLPQPPVRGIL